MKIGNPHAEDFFDMPSDGLKHTDTPTPARPALDASLAKVKAFLAFDSFPAGETTSPTFEALRVVIDDYDRVVRSLADMRTALERIERWEMPETNEYWDKEKTRRMSYAALYGSNGERDFVRGIAQAALARSAP